MPLTRVIFVLFLASSYAIGLQLFQSDAQLQAKTLSSYYDTSRLTTDTARGCDGFCR